MLSCTTPYGTLQLQRYPASRDTVLQAFDTADLYLLQRVQQEPESDQPLLVINDSFGTLACALAAAGKTVHSWGDSWMSWRALQSNLAANGLGSDAVQFFNSTETPTGHYQQVVLRIPKSLSLLQDQLQCLRALLTDQALLLAGSMIKHLPPSAGDLLAAHIGPYQASLGWKKARLLQCQYDPALQPRSRDLVSHYPLEGTTLQLSNHAAAISSATTRWKAQPCN